MVECLAAMWMNPTAGSCLLWQPWHGLHTVTAAPSRPQPSTLRCDPSTSVAILGLYVGLELEVRLTELFSYVVLFAFNALTLLVGWQEGHLACKNWVVRYWHGYLSGARCRWFAYGPADATATASSLAPVKSRMIYLCGASLPRFSWKKAAKRM